MSSDLHLSVSYMTTALASSLAEFQGVMQTGGCTMERKSYSLLLFGVLLVCFSGALSPSSGKGATVE